MSIKILYYIFKDSSLIQFVIMKFLPEWLLFRLIAVFYKFDLLEGLRNFFSIEVFEIVQLPRILHDFEATQPLQRTYSKYI